MSIYRCHPLDRPPEMSLTLPGSKSITNRALAIAALAQGRSTLQNVLCAQDTQAMIGCLRTLGIAVSVDEASSVAEVTGCRGQLPMLEADLFCGGSGTAMRFCIGICSLGHGDFRLDGSRRLRQRPVGELVEALRALGTRVEFEDIEGYPPLVVHAEGLGGGYVLLESPRSSQFVSALLIVAPYAMQDVFIEVRGEVLSRPYIRTTLKVMEAFGVSVMDSDDPGVLRFIVEAPRVYEATRYEIEPDATAASYFFAAAALTGGTVFIERLGRQSIQGDARFPDVLEKMGCTVFREQIRLGVRGPEGGKLRGVEVDLKDMPDTVQTLAALALAADSPTTIHGIATLRWKETDRVAALETEIRRLGGSVEVEGDTIRIEPPARIRAARIKTYDDHRMAMSFAVLGLKVADIEIEDPECCAKTLPDFFQRLESLR